MVLVVVARLRKTAIKYSPNLSFFYGSSSCYGDSTHNTQVIRWTNYDAAFITLRRGVFVALFGFFRDDPSHNSAVIEDNLSSRSDDGMLEHSLGEN